MTDQLTTLEYAGIFHNLTIAVPLLLLSVVLILAWASYKAHHPPAPPNNLADVIRRIQTQNQPHYLMNQKRKG